MATQRWTGRRDRRCAAAAAAIVLLGGGLVVGAAPATGQPSPVDHGTHGPILAEGPPQGPVRPPTPEATADPAFVNPAVNGTVNTIAIQDDGAILIGGDFTTVATETRQHVARLNDDGTLDTTFTDPAINATVRSIVPATIYERIVVAGDFTMVGAQPRGRIARLESNGALDLTFGDTAVDARVSSVVTAGDTSLVIGGSFSNVDAHARGGVARLNVYGDLDGALGNPQPDGDVLAVAVQADGRVILGGDFTTVGQEESSRVARLLATSTPRSGVPGGTIMSNLTPQDDYARAVVAQPDGKFVVAGEIGREGGQFGVARYRANAGLDPTFSGDGWTTINLSPGWDEANAVALQADGKIVAVGYSEPGRIVVARFRTNGTLDPTFSGDGKVVTNLTPGFEFATGVVIQPDGRIVVAGEIGGLGGQFVVLRYLANGALDPSFSGNGWAAANFSAGDDWAWDVALQPDGKIVAAGIARGGSGAPDPTMAIARWNTDGTFDPTFSGDGRAMPSVGPRPEIASAVRVQPDGRIVVAGQYGFGRSGAFMAARFTDSGAFDNSFSDDGKATVDFTTGEDFAWDLAIQGSGRIVLAGASAGRGGEFAVARLRANGVLDQTFGTNGKSRTNMTAAYDAATAVAIQPGGLIVTVGGAGGEPGTFAVAKYWP